MHIVGFMGIEFSLYFVIFLISVRSVVISLFSDICNSYVLSFYFLVSLTRDLSQEKKKKNKI